MKTHLPKVNLDQRKWHIIDANAASSWKRLICQGTIFCAVRTKPSIRRTWMREILSVVNAEKVRVTGKKETKKEYMTYSGWKGGEKYTSVEQMRERHPEMLIHRAVRGMIPKNRLGRVLLTKLKVYKGDKHPHSAQQPAALAIAK